MFFFHITNNIVRAVRTQIPGKCLFISYIMLGEVSNPITLNNLCHKNVKFLMSLSKFLNFLNLNFFIRFLFLFFIFIIISEVSILNLVKLIPRPPAPTYSKGYGIISKNLVYPPLRWPDNWGFVHTLISPLTPCSTVKTKHA